MLNPWIRLGWPAKSSETLLMTPGVSMLQTVSHATTPSASRTGSRYSRLAFKVLHNIEKLVVDIRLLVKLDFNLVQVG